MLNWRKLPGGLCGTAYAYKRASFSGRVTFLETTETSKVFTVGIVGFDTAGIAVISEFKTVNRLQVKKQQQRNRISLVIPVSDRLFTSFTKSFQSICRWYRITEIPQAIVNVGMLEILLASTVAISWPRVLWEALLILTTISVRSRLTARVFTFLFYWRTNKDEFEVIFTQGTFLMERFWHAQVHSIGTEELKR